MLVPRKRFLPCIRTAQSVIWLCVIGLVCAGCNQRNDTTQLPTEDVDSTAVGTSTEPVGHSGNPYHAMLTKKALTGLNYSTGRVTIDRTHATALTRSLSVDNANQRFESGRQAIASGQLLEAFVALTQAIILNPNRAEYYEVLGSALLLKRKPQFAESAFRSALDLNPDSVFSHQQLALTLSGTGRFNEAISTYGTVLRLDPENGLAHRRLAVLLYYSGQNNASQEHVQLAQDNGEVIPPQFLELLNRGGAVREPQQAGPENLNGQADPVVGDQMRVDLGNSAQANETTAASSDADTNFAIAGWNDYRSNIRSGFAMTFDGGDSWQDFLLRPPVPFQTSVEGDPMTCSDSRTGNIWAGAIAFGGNGGVYVARKNAGDANFQPTVMAEVTGGADKGWMAAGVDPFNSQATRMYIGYNQGLLVSTNNGDTWTGPIAFPEFGLGWQPRIGPNGELYLSYWDVSDGNKLLRSLDGGATFQGPFTISTRMDVWFIDGSRFPGRFRVAPLVTTAVDPVSGTLYATWFDTTNVVAGNSNVDIYCCRSTDQGTTWSTPTIVNTDAAIPGDQFFSWIEVDNSGRLHLLFYDTRSVPQNDNTTDGPGQPPAIIEAWYAYSDDAGDSWSEIVLTPQPFSSANDGFGDGFIGDYLGIGVGGTTVYPCYMSTQEGISKIYVHAITNPFLLGDINQDGVVNLLDVGPFVELLTAGVFEKIADINGDGALNLLDVGPFVDLLDGI